MTNRFFVGDAPRNKYERYNMTLSSYEKALEECLNGANGAYKLKKRYLTYKADYGANDELTLKLKNRAISKWNKAQELKVKIEDYKKNNNPFNR